MYSCTHFITVQFGGCIVGEYEEVALCGVHGSRSDRGREKENRRYLFVCFSLIVVVMKRVMCGLDCCRVC